MYFFNDLFLQNDHKIKSYLICAPVYRSTSIAKVLDFKNKIKVISV